MAPRLVPSNPVFESKAEEAVWKHLKAQLPPTAFLAANVHLHSHQDFYEADLVVGWPDLGFVVIEVKGGVIWHTDDGWLQGIPEGNKRVDPAGQADRAKRLLDTYARARGWPHGPIRFEHMVAFPDVDFDDQPPAPDVPRWALIARGDLDTAGEKVMRALTPKESHHPVPTAYMVDEMADLIGGRPDPATSLLATSRAREEHVERLTQQQAEALRYMRANDRIKVVGGPGTGKTWVALEQAGTWASEGKKVLFVCYSVGLSRWLRQAVDALGDKLARNIEVSTYSAYLVRQGVTVPDDADQEWWDVTLPQLAAEQIAPHYDGLIVDEAQDVADTWWPPLLASLHAPRVLVAGDERQAVFANRRGAPDLDLTVMTLDKNVRNTAQIASVFSPLTPERMTVIGGDGPPVGFVPCRSDEAFDTADSIVERLISSGHNPGSIAVLTTGSRHPNHKRVEAELEKSGYWDGFWLDDEVFYGTVMGFKGLERPVIVLAVDSFHEGVEREVLYTGLSRARDQLVVCGDLDMIGSVGGNELRKRLAKAEVRVP